MPSAGDLRRQLALTLRSAYGEGLLSQRTLVQRLDVLFGSAVVEPGSLIGDLAVRTRRRSTITGAVQRAMQALRERLGPALPAGAAPPAVLALDWTGARDELLVGRHPDCDIVRSDLSVSRRHARLTYRDGSWILHDLESTNGTTVNGTPVVRCRLLPGDRVGLGGEVLVVD